MRAIWQQESKESSFLRSALTTEGHFQSIDDVLAWFRSRRASTWMKVCEIPFDEMDLWHFADHAMRLVHRSAKFFTIEGIRVQSSGPIPEWDQPIINQPEVGILGIITRTWNGTRQFLMQAKMEPGNANIMQLSPTVQATYSNYTRVHRGTKPLYHEYFVKRSDSRVLVDQLQSEQGARFLRKRNRNMIVEVSTDIAVHDDFCWLTLGQIQQLLKLDNVVNMDARSVISCIPFDCIDGLEKHAMHLRADSDYVDVFGHRLNGFRKDLLQSMLGRGNARHSLDEIISWFTELKATSRLSVERIPLNQARGWVLTDREIRHETGRYFSVIAVSVDASSREVMKWTQPLLKHTGYGVVGFLCQRINDVLHVLVRASLEPGNLDVIDMGPTVACSNAAERIKHEPPDFLELFLTAAPHRIRYSTIQSEEGGRFHRFQNRYMIVELSPNDYIDVPDHFVWMTLAQAMALLKHGYFNIEARNLLACMSLVEA
jgi:dTDP-4-dehydro-6-deoxy-alpha-D-glucopyranose 2,3-dehydratase